MNGTEDREVQEVADPAEHEEPASKRAERLVTAPQAVVCSFPVQRARAQANSRRCEASVMLHTLRTSVFLASQSGKAHGPQAAVGIGFHGK